MITNLLFTAIYAVVYALAQLILILPPVNTESDFAVALAGLASYLANINEIFPLTTVFVVMGIILLTETGVMIYKIIMWVIRRIPTQS